MDRRLILAVAGSGKTTYLINTLNLKQRFLIVTYTDNNVKNIRQRIINTFGYVPQNITLMSYFQFLIRVCYRPFLKDKFRAKGITWNMPSQETLKLKRNNPLFYLTKGRYLYHNRIAKLCLECCVNLIKERIEKFYDYFMFDEIQDLGGHDFNLLQAITPTAIDCLSTNILSIPAMMEMLIKGYIMTTKNTRKYGQRLELLLTRLRFPTVIDVRLQLANLSRNNYTSKFLLIGKIIQKSF